MLLALMLTGAHAATVSVSGGEGCLTAVAIQVELDDVDGLIGSDRVLVDLVRPESGWTLHVRVVRRQVSVWRRSLPVEPADCPLVPSVLARSIERGLDGVPRWPLASDRQDWLLGVQTATSWPYLEWSAAVSVGRGPPPRGTWSWELDVGGFARAAQPVGTGRASLAGLMVGFGPVAQARVGATRFGLQPRIAGGVGFATGSGFVAPVDRAAAAPRVAGSLEGHVRFPQRIHVGIRTSWIPVFAVLRDTVRGNMTEAREPAVRVGLVFGLHGPLRQ